jgi:uncharacterized protein DUF6188
MSDDGKADFNTGLTQVLSSVVGQRVTLFRIDWRVELPFTDTAAGQSIIIETPFTIGQPGTENLVVPGEYGASIAEVIALPGERVTAVSTKPDIVQLRLSFSNGSDLAVIGDGWPQWEFAGPAGGPWIVSR